MRVSAIGYGAGSGNPPGFPNVLRLSIGESASLSAAGASLDGVAAADAITVLETAVDDLSPQILAHVAETALARGALDVMLTPAVMKKGRPGTLITVLAAPADAAAMVELLLAETTTLGVRTREERRSVLARAHHVVRTQFGELRVKVGTRGGEERNAAPEFEDCRAAAALHKVPLKLVIQAALNAYAEENNR